jgi:hypothetical protein
LLVYYLYTIYFLFFAALVETPASECAVTLALVDGVPAPMPSLDELRDEVLKLNLKREDRKGVEGAKKHTIIV